SEQGPDVQGARNAARRADKDARRARTRADRPYLRLGRHRLQQPVGDGIRRPDGLAVVPGIMERVERRSVATDRALTAAADRQRERGAYFTVAALCPNRIFLASSLIAACSRYLGPSS